MDVTFIVGNGFDVSLGLHTSYREFYDWYCKQLSELGHITDFKNEIADDINCGGVNWSDFEVGLGKYTEKFEVSNANKFLNCYEDAHERMHEFILREEESFDVDKFDKDDIAYFRDGILNYYQELPSRESNRIKSLINSDNMVDTTISFISFNYTNVLDKCVEKFLKDSLKVWFANNTMQQVIVNTDVIHVHGTTKRFPCLGVNDENQIVNKQLLDVPHFTQTMIKSESVKAIGESWHDEAEKIIDKSKIICVYGMSLGSSDAKWWKRILDKLKDSDDKHLIIYWYSKNPPNNISIYRQMQENAKIKNLLLSYGDLTDVEKNSVSDRIYIIHNSNKVLKLPIKTKRNATSPK